MREMIQFRFASDQGMKRLLLATRNAHKQREISQLLAGLGIEVRTLEAYPAIPETVEDQPTLEGNAAKKARECASGSGEWSLADDTGLEVEALGGAPGVYSARYAGPGCAYADNNRKLLAALGARADRKARFRTVMALASADGLIVLEEGRLDGRIATEARGTNGFGYDPVFIVDGMGKTLAELSAEEKNAISHRARALQAMLPHIKRLVCAALLGFAAFAWSPALPANAARTEPGQTTIWDEIMADQANRELRIGARFLDSKQYDLALRELERAVAANPRDANAQMMLGVAYYWNGEVDKSIDCYQKSIEIGPDDAQPHMLLGISLAYKGQSQAAYQEFEKSAALDPSRADIQMNLGSIEDTLGRTQDALEHFRKAAQLAPKDPLYPYQLGTMYRRLGRDQDAIDSLHEALKDMPDFEDALLELGAVEERAGDQKDAMSHFKRAVSLKERDSVARLRLGRLYLAQHLRQKARDVFVDAFHLTPEEGGPGLQLSVSYAGGKRELPGQGGPGQPSAAKPAQPDANDPLSVFQRNLERVPLDQNALMQVDVLFVPKPQLVKRGPGEVSTLGKALQRELGQKPQVKAVRREFHIDAGNPMQRQQQIAQVLEELRGVMQSAPAGSDVRLGMNLAFTKPTATAAVGRADAANPPKVSYEPRQVGNDLGLWIIGTGWMSLVEEVLPEPGEKPDHPDDTDWWLATGLGYAAVGDGQRALGAFERSTELDPRNDTAWLGRAVALVMTGDEKSAESALREALKVNPKNKPASEGLKWLLRPSTAAPGAAVR